MRENSRRQAGTAGRPLRVVVVGSSVTFMVVPPVAGPDDDAYPALLDEELLDRGITSVTYAHARWHATAKEVLKQTEPWIRDHHPDVVVLNVGFVDCQARVLPTWLYRHAITWLPGLSGLSVRYRQRVVPHLRRAIRTWQRVTVGHVGLRLSRLAPGPFRRAVQRLVRQAVRDHSALVLVLDIDGPGPALQHWQPGIDARIASYNAILADVVRGLDDPRVVLLPTSSVVMGDQERLLPDGIHRSAEGHRLVAAAVADAVAVHVGLRGQLHGA